MTAERRATGATGEALAAAWYERRGYRVVDRNWRRREGELDLVLRCGRTVVFCEVKTRRGTGFGSPAEAVTADKQRRLRRLAVLWLTEGRRSAADVRFDVASVQGDVVEVLEGAF